MNKKAYISPELHIIQVKAQSMIAASGDFVRGISDDEVTSGWADSREFLWDTDDEYFEE